MPLSAAEEVEEWQVVCGKFLAINATNMSCACPRSPRGLSPAAHLGDGSCDLILIRKCSRFNFLRFLVRHTNQRDQVGARSVPRGTAAASPREPVSERTGEDRVLHSRCTPLTPSLTRPRQSSLENTLWAHRPARVAARVGLSLLGQTAARR